MRPGRARQESRGAGRGLRLAAQVRRMAARTGAARRGASHGRSTGPAARGRIARLRTGRRTTDRRVIVKARVVRQHGARFRAAPMARHLGYLQRDGVTRDGSAAVLFDACSDDVDARAFAARCEPDRHHFRFIVSPEDAQALGDLRVFTRELMRDVATDLATRLDWAAVDHWNTDNPHVHVLVRGVDDTGGDLVIDRDYIREGMRCRAEERATLELGPRSEMEVRSALEREVEAQRWTGLDRTLCRLADAADGIIDLRPGADVAADMRGLLLGRASTLERHGLAAHIGPAMWTMRADAETVLRDVAMRTDVIKTMHRALLARGDNRDPADFVTQAERREEPVIGKLVERGLQDELTGSAYAIIDGIDGRVHHLTFADLDMTGDAAPGAIVELRSWSDSRRRERLSLATRSDIPLREQIGASGATWLDRQLLARGPETVGGSGFGLELEAAMVARARQLEQAGHAQQRGAGLVFSRDLLKSLRASELEQAQAKIATRTGLAHQPSGEGEYVSGIYRERVTLASGRFAMIEDGLGFQLVPWRPALERELGQHVTGVMGRSGVDWSFGRGRELGR